MSIEERRGGDENEFEDFKFPPEFDEGNKLEAAEIVNELKIEIEISKEDIEGIVSQMERERGREGLDGGQRLAFEGAALARLRKEAPEAGIEDIKLSDEDIEKCRQRMEKDIENAVIAKTKDGERKGWDGEKIKEEIKSEQVWISEFQESYLKDILGKEKFEEKGLRDTEAQWNEKVEDLKKLIAKKDWHKVIPRMGHMNNLEPEKFGEISRSLFDSDDKEGLINHINELKGVNSSYRKKIRVANPWELASRIRYVAECFPELVKQIEIDEKDQKNMKKHLQEAKDKQWEEKDQETKGRKGDYWTVAYQECNMKIIENLVKSGKIKAAKTKA